MPGDVLFIAGVLPLVYLTARAVLRPARYLSTLTGPQATEVSPLYTEVLMEPAAR